MQIKLTVVVVVVDSIGAIWTIQPLNDCGQVDSAIRWIIDYPGPEKSIEITVDFGAILIQ